MHARTHARTHTVSCTCSFMMTHTTLDTTISHLTSSPAKSYVFTTVTVPLSVWWVRKGGTKDDCPLLLAHSTFSHCMYICMYVCMYVCTFTGGSVEAFEESLGSFATGGRSLVAVSCLKVDHKSSIRFSSCFSVLFLSSSSTCLASSSVTTDPVGALSFLRTRATHHHEHSQNTKIPTLCTYTLTSLATSGEEAASSQGASASTTTFTDLTGSVPSFEMPQCHH